MTERHPVKCDKCLQIHYAHLPCPPLWRVWVDNEEYDLDSDSGSVHAETAAYAAFTFAKEWDLCDNEILGGATINFAVQKAGDLEVLKFQVTGQWDPSYKILPLREPKTP